MPRRLEDDLMRHQLAREVIPQLVEATERFLKYFPRIAQRRVPDRIAFLSDLASDVLAWTALGAPRDENQLPVRCFATSCLLDSDPHRISWQTLAMSGIEAEVRTYVRALASEVTGLPTARPDPEWLRGEAESVLDEVRALMERLRANQATSGDGLRVGRQLLASAIALDPVLAEDGLPGNLTCVGAFGLLERTLLTDDFEDRLTLAAILEKMASTLPGLVEHAASHQEDDDEEELEGDKATAAFGDEELKVASFPPHAPGEQPPPRGERLAEHDEDNGFRLDDVLIALDGRLSMTEEASEGADVAFHVACALLIQAVDSLQGLPPTFEARVRATAAGDVLMSTAGGERGTGPFEAGVGTALLETTYSRAAALLEADLPGQPRAVEPVEVPLSELDELVGAMVDMADEELVEELPGALALIGGAAQTLLAGVRLGHQDADTQTRMATALGALDPLALADLSEVRAAAARTLRELARSAPGTTARHASAVPRA